MKRTLFAVSLTVFGVSNCFAQGQCYPKWYIGSTIYEQSNRSSLTQTFADTLVEASESIWLTVSSQLFCTGECSPLSPEKFMWIHNGDTVNAGHLLIEDTGLYIGTIRYSGCGPGMFRFNLRVGFKPSISTNAEKTISDFKIYPTISEGKYTIESSVELAKIQIRNSAGNLVFTKGHHETSIDLTHLPNGIYFYYVEDRLGHTMLGKIVKR
jgi:hypothetical protein